MEERKKYVAGNSGINTTISESLSSRFSGEYSVRGWDNMLTASMVGQYQPFTRLSPKTGRNNPCPCDSEMKFKKCCGKQEN